MTMETGANSVERLPFQNPPFQSSNEHDNVIFETAWVIPSKDSNWNLHSVHSSIFLHNQDQGNNSMLNLGNIWYVPLLFNLKL